MAILNQIPQTELLKDNATYYHLMIEAIKIALQKRNRALCDPEVGSLDTDAWLSTAQNDVNNIHYQRAGVWSDPAQPADTAWLAAIDAHGRGASVIQSLFYDWGSACTIGDTGILWHNRGAAFASNKAHPNAWAPRKRPAHTLNPSLYVRHNGERILFGSQGGDGQPQTQTVLATQLIDRQVSVAEALHSPRFLLGRSFFDSDDNLKLEGHLDESVVQILRDYGHDVEVIPSLSPLAGLAGIAQLSPDGCRTALHDPRGDSLTLGLA